MSNSGVKKVHFSFIFQLLCLISLVFFSYQTYAAANNWSFDVQGNYTVSDVNSIDISSSIATLKEKFNHIGSVTDGTVLNGADDVVVDGNYAYMTAYNGDRFQVIDISDPTSPIIVATLQNNGGTIRLDGASSLVKDGNYIYIASQVSDAVQIIDVSSPTSPVAIAQVLNSPTSNRLNGARGIVKNGNYLYVSSQSDHSIVVIDVSNPVSPVWITALRDTTNLRGTRGLYVSGNYIFATAYTRDRITSVDISNPIVPVIDDSITDTRLNGAWKITISGNYAYVSSYIDDSLQIVDISDPSNLFIAQSIDDGGDFLLNGARGLLIEGNTLFITANVDDAVSAIDISNPLSPLFLNSILNSGGSQELNGARGVFKVGNYLYIASGVSDGLEILTYEYDSQSPDVIPNTGYDYLGYNILGFSETLGGGNQGTVTYQISKNDGITWYYYNGASWQTTVSGVINSSSASIIHTNISTFDALGGGTDIFTFKAFLTSNGTQQVELDGVSVIVSDDPGPGGVGTNLQIWLKADQGTSTTTDGNSVSSWNDQSGNGFNAGGGVSPIYRSNTTDSLNFNPVIDFNGSTQYLENLNNGAYTDSYLLVVVPDSTIDGTITGQVPFGFDCFSGILSTGTCGLSFAGVTLGAFTAAINDEVITHAIGSSVNLRTSQIGIASYDAGKPMLIISNENSGANGLELYEKGLQVDNYTVNTYQTLSTADYALGRSLDNTYPFYYNGKIAEVINYSGRIADADRERLESYLSLKYGMTLNSGVQNYTASDGLTSIWSTASAGSYIHDIFGIGRDDISELGQIKSKSVNNDNIITIEAISEGTNSSPSFVDIGDFEFLTLANNDGGNTWTAVDAPAGYYSLSRIWRVQETGELGTVNLDFDLANINFDVPVLSAGTDYYFVYDSDNDNSLADEIPQVMINTSGDIWQIPGINLNNTREFTIATLSSTNNIPTDISVSNNSINENIGAGSTVGTFTTTDADIGDSHVYTFVAGSGDDDNGLFSIVGSILSINISPDYEIKSTFSIRIQTDDGNGGQYQETFTININNIGETVNSIIDFENILNEYKYNVTSGTWTRTTTNPNEGSYSFESSNGGDNTQSCFEVTHTFDAVGTINFDYEVSSQAGSDYLRFYIDNVDTQNWSGTVPWATYSNNTIVAGTHQYKWCFIKDGGGSSGTDNAFIDYITFENTAVDSTDPVISSINFSSGSLLPGGNHNIVINYSDAESGINTSSDIISLNKWNGSSWGADISATGFNLGSKVVTATSATYPTNDLSFGKYRYSFQIFDNNGNSATTGAVFYIDIPELIVSTGSLDAGTLPSGGLNFSTDEIIITVRTLGAGFDVQLSKDATFDNGGSSIIIDWDGLEGVGYDAFPYSGTNLNINLNPVIATQIQSLNTDGLQNTYTYNIKIGTLIDELQAAGNYTTSLSFYLNLSY
ncbi:hypothetical protein A9Q91_03825 [Candidatus Gracilibacteria bacterium 28_42_T64]|nr:hypothetical protein A9Q91_03825 [Candidatus Gracilibacteria bacterium 28_42_T64]